MGLKKFGKRLFTVAAAPVVIPTRAAAQKVERYAMNRILAALIRHGLTAIGGAGFVASDTEVEQIVTAAMTLIGFAWSIYEKRQQAAPPTATAEK